MVPSPPPLPPRPPVRTLTSNISSAVLKSARASLKAVQVPVVKFYVEVGKVVEGVPVSGVDDSDVHEHSYALAPSPAVHIEAETEDNVHVVKQVGEVNLNSSVTVKKTRLSRQLKQHQTLLRHQITWPVLLFCTTSFLAVGQGLSRTRAAQLLSTLIYLDLSSSCGLILALRGDQQMRRIGAGESILVFRTISFIKTWKTISS